MFLSRTRFFFFLSSAFLCVLCGDLAVCGEVGVVSHVKVLSDKVEDVSNLEAWKKSFIKDGMSDEEKAKAVWQSVVKFRHQDPPPIEFLTGDGGDVHDPIKTFNVYGYNMCCCESSNILALSRYLGLKARGWGINGHSVPEITWDGNWHLMDASLVCYFNKPDGKVAGVEEIIGGIQAWYGQHPEFKNNNDKLYKFMGGGGWKHGPDVLANTSAYDNNGWLPAATHGWYSTMQEYDGRGGGAGNKAFLYEYGYSQGYEVNIQLRPGERLTRNWSNKGLHINMDLGKDGPGCLTGVVGKDQLRYSAALGDLAPGRVGNGTYEYDVPLANGGFRTAALTAENLEECNDGHAPKMHIHDATKPATLILDIPSSYVYLSGELQLNAKVASGGGGEIDVSLSDNNGLDWKDVSKITASGEQKIDLKPLVYRRYDYRLKLAMKGQYTGVDSLKIVHDIQHSQRPLPALDKGENKISFSAGAPESTVTIQAGATLEHKDKQLVFTDYHPVIEGMKNDMLILTGGTGQVTFPISTPGEMTRVRFGSFYRARDAKDNFDYQVSFDGGKTFKTIDRAAGPTGNGLCKYVTFNEVPAGTKDAMVRFAGTQRNTTMISNLRIDADYKQPNGGFRPVKISYKWDENGQAKEDIHVAKSADDSYSINCAAKPTMKSITLELAE